MMNVGMVHGTVVLKGLSCKALRELRGHFPILAAEVNGRPLAYLDNAATMQVPDCV